MAIPVSMDGLPALARAMRRATDKSLSQLARETGVTHAQTSRVESGKERPSLRLMLRWAEACGYELVARPKRKTSAKQ